VQPIAIITNSLSGGGAEQSAQILYSELRKTEFRIFWIGINAENPLEVPISDDVFSLNRTKQQRLFETIAVFLRFVKLIKSKSITTLIVNCELPELFAAFTPLPLKLFIVEHANPSWYKRDLLGFMVRKILKFRRAQFIQVSPHLKPRFVYPPTSVTIPNPLLDNSVREFGNPGTSIRRLAYVGRLSAEFKNPEYLLLIAQKVNLEVIFIGDGVLKDSLEKMARVLGVKVTFVGFQRKPWSYLSSGDLLIIPSSAEGDGLVLIEAVQRGIPFLATQIPDLNRYGISDENYCNDIGDFVSRIRKYQESIGLLVVSSQLSMQILEGRSVERIVKSWIQVLKD
jgi:hypothetical protein